MPKRKSSADGHDGRKPTKRRSRRRLYLITNDGEDRYGVRKFDLFSDSHSGDDEDAQASPQRLPRALFRFCSPVRGLFAASGTMILALLKDDEHSSEKSVAAFDVRDRSLGLCHRYTPLYWKPVYLPVGNNLLALERSAMITRSELLHLWPGGFESPTRLPGPPFDRVDVISHAVHPDGRTIFVSAETETYSFDTGSEAPDWRCHGEWTLPFKGRAHYDLELNAWVGLSGGEDTLGYLCCCDVLSNDDHAGGEDTLGYLCCCDVLSDDDHAGGDTQPPAWKLSKERLFGEDLAEKYAGASLVCLGVRRFCLVQYFSVKDDDDESCSDAKQENGHKHMLRLMTFSLKRDKKGDMRIGKRRLVRCYQLPRAPDTLEDPVAFWM